MKPLSALILSIALIACEQGSMRPPEVLAREPFTAVLCDLQLVEARINHELVVEPIGTIPSDRYAEEVFARNGVTKEEFRTSLAYYGARHEEMTAIYEDVITELTRRKDRSPTAVDPQP
ncbi:MAG: DUF4296 domain-containing protein [Flavobacteriales bacterium]|jgi:hypothetical protein|nr:DUF4296 domain-containing protein [Flavobacteriales bacterium]MBP7448633.1 DUF4296 domain-containing protein [Flavobacteriales bacterium]HOZ40418.1 DUF4296 domain-containing protein [Flavobacteriales bacterium]